MLLPMSPADSMFLLGESREHPMHVGGLALLAPPEGGDADDVRAMLDSALAGGAVSPVLRKRPRRSLTSLGQWGWEEDVEVDLSHHIRHSALPQPGGVKELLELVSRLHAHLLDRNRPLWEMHLIEGLSDGRFAVYMKIHHAVTDGVSAMKLLRSTLSEDSGERGMPAPWEPLARDRPARVPAAAPDGFNLLGLPGAAVGAVRGAFGLLPVLATTVDRARNNRGGSLSLAAPKSILNVPIGGARRFAARSWPIERLRLVAKAGDATINDVVLAMCSGALRSYLDELDVLPADPLVALVPVSLRREGVESKSGNDFGLLSCNLATHLEEPAERFDAVRKTMGEGKEEMSTRSSGEILAMSALGAVPLVLGVLFGERAPIRPPNVMISNVPGPGMPLYWNGARLTALYPLSIAVDGQALNITITSTDDEIAFGITGCRRSVPPLAPLLGCLDDELGALEAAVGL
ncbi:WS/DGAT/MGAT family O-acyltransferase [Rhodococcus tukisamuensis]|uniref:Diacylglycerol O-acyltransferase n=1 Tax=Rhodococcus tukisamuensis TaxID=168276 RepID=A0A1G6QZK0_9NOCA|nr:wax ester/triacylglycerol synthase family O-acyltransferase [Rhodococcus tukisamuensis]SDC97762.1 acyltransferase, WS/DGAT/MGAT [Rhodococcus tukisamuensis]